MKTPLQLIKAVYNRLDYYLCPDKIFLNRKFKKVFGRDINWKNPVTFNEKLQWLKVNDRKPQYSEMVDKFAAKEFIQSRHLNVAVVKSFGVWERFEDIDFDALPDQFVLKCTHDSNSVIVCRSKEDFDFAAAKRFLENRLRNNFYYNCREWPYKHVMPRIIAEEYMQIMADGMIDYKFYCFHGKAKCLYVSQGLEDHATARISFLNLDWTPAGFKRSDFAAFETLPPRPSCLEEMIQLAETLSAEHAFLRVDLYEIDSQVYFSELTFYPCGGFMPFDPPEWDEIVGSWLELPHERRRAK